MTDARPAHPHAKALQLNLDPLIFGSFAEIGAGQEVARWFFRVGAASGTVAKTVCAYDKAVSDHLYGAGERYVSRPRVESMLRIEWSNLRAQVGNERPDARLFAFADTAAARNYKGTNVCHAWAGVRFQREPRGPEHDLIVHVNLRDDSNEKQQEAMGILGVNLVHAAFHAADSPEEFVEAIFDELDISRIEIDLVGAVGPGFDRWNHKRLNTMLVVNGLAECVFFDLDGRTEPPAEALYKTPIVLAPGRFRRVEEMHGQALSAAATYLRESADDSARPCRAFFAMPVADLENVDVAMDRLEALEPIGCRCQGGIMLHRREELYHMSQFLRRYSNQPIRFAVSLGVLVRVFEEARYDGLEGRLLEAVARLFEYDVHMDVFPSLVSQIDDRLRPLVRGNPDHWVTVEHLRPEPPLSLLMDYLIAAKLIVPRPPVAALAAAE